MTASSASGKVYEILLDLIMTFRLKPFALLSEEAVSDVLSISRSPVREALARLATVRLVDIYAQRGTVVAPLSIEDLRRSQFLRGCVEVGLLQRACELTSRAALLKRLESEISLQTTLASIEDDARFARSDELSHQYIGEAVGFEGVWQEIGNAKPCRGQSQTTPGHSLAGDIIPRQTVVPAR